MSKSGLLTLAEAARALPVPAHPATISRWVRNGLHGQRLPAIRCGGKLRVQADELRKFIDAVSTGRQS